MVALFRKYIIFELVSVYNLIKSHATTKQILSEWKNDSQRKPLLLRGARQVGKSSAVRNLGKSFDYYIEVNFERNPEIMQFFSLFAIGPLIYL